MDVLAVHDAGMQAVAHCRAGNGPYLLEMKTYRYRGHSMSDPARYRTREEVQDMREHHDSIQQARQKLQAMGVDEATLKSIEDEVRTQVQEAAEAAQQTPEPDASELYTDVLLEG